MFYNLSQGRDMMSGKIKSFGLMVLGILLLGACTTTYRADVTRFHELTEPEGESFIVIAKSEDKKDSLELKSYAALISEHLRMEGYTPAGTGTPEVIVKIDYAISPPIQQTRREGYPGPFFGGFYYHGGGYYSGLPYYYPYYSPIGYRRHGYGYGYGYGFGYYPYPRTYVVYERALEMVIERNGGGVLFEGLVKSVGREKDLTKIIPVLARAMFTNFPGESGTTERIKIKSDRGAKY
jgi:hypothetical protein